MKADLCCVSIGQRNNDNPCWYASKEKERENASKEELRLGEMPTQWCSG